MTTRRICLQLLSATGLATTANLAKADAAAQAAPLTYVDPQGVWRWQKDQSEIALYGVNYCLMSASPFRAAKRVGSDLKACIRHDLNHLKRMGQHAIRLCFWGDWENSTPRGNLIVNEHLELLDYLVAEATKRGFYMLLSPIVTYDAWWPDAMDQKKGGFASVFKKEDLGQARQPIQAQVTYLNELLRRTNPLTGHTYGTEPNIIAVEPINEPTHHPDKPEISKLYLNIMAKAVRSGGFQGPIFFNVTQDMRMAPFIRDEPLLAGATFAWYPEGLQEQHPVRGNHLLIVEDYPQMRQAEFKTKVKMVYEFDATMTMRSYVHTAMARAFRQGGAQWATMFTYDAVDIADNNVEMNDHYLNLVYTPSKAVGMLVAATAFRELERETASIPYPQNKRFAGVELDPTADLALYRDATRFFHSNSTTLAPGNVQALQHIAGVGSSPVVTYEGLGAYFLDKEASGLWRLDVYPDVLTGENPFPIQIDKRDRALLFTGAREMTIKLPDLGETFDMLKGDGGKLAQAMGGRIRVEPGVYYLRSGDASLPAGGAPEFYAPVAKSQAEVCRVYHPRLIEAGQTLKVEVIFTGEAKSLSLSVGSQSTPLKGTGRVFHFEGTLPVASIVEGAQTLRIAKDGTAIWTGQVPVTAKWAALALIDPARDVLNLNVPYGGYGSYPNVKIIAESGVSILRLDGKNIATAGEYVGQFLFDETLDAQAVSLTGRSKLVVSLAKPVLKPSRFNVALIEFDGHAFQVTLRALPGQSTVEVSLADLKPGDVTWMPREFPKGIAPYTRGTPAHAVLNLGQVSSVQIRIGKAFTGPGDDPEPQIDIKSIQLI